MPNFVGFRCYFSHKNTIYKLSLLKSDLLISNAGVLASLILFLDGFDGFWWKWAKLLEECVCMRRVEGLGWGFTDGFE